jgi:hypothetical protein
LDKSDPIAPLLVPNPENSAPTGDGVWAVAIVIVPDGRRIVIDSIPNAVRAPVNAEADNTEWLCDRCVNLKKPVRMR